MLSPSIKQGVLRSNERNSTAMLQMEQTARVAEAKENDPRGGAAGVITWLDTGRMGRKQVQLLKKNRIDIWHYNAYSRLRPSLAMHKMGQWRCLIQVNDFFAVSSFAFYAC